MGSYGTTTSSVPGHSSALSDNPGQTLREQLNRRLYQLRQSRYSWEYPWRDILEQISPYRQRWWNYGGRFGRNRGDRREYKIINNTPTRAINTLAAGLMAGVTSPARTWFSLTVTDRDLNENPSVKMYLDTCRDRIETMLHQSNWYNVLSNSVYLDLGTIGTACIFSEEIEPGLLHYRSIPVGEFYLDIDKEGNPDTCFREFEMDVRQLVKKFGEENCSRAVRDHWRRGNHYINYKVVHAVFPNEDYERGKLGVPGKAWKSCWWELTNPDKQQFLRESGYDDFPVHAPRWSTTDGDVYGRGPGWEIRGDCRSLQYMEKKLLKIIDKTVDPPMRASDRVQRASLLPGDITYVPRGLNGMFEPAMTVPPQAIEGCLLHIDRHEKRINEAMYVHILQNLLQDDRNQRATATEVEAQRQEVMLMLGPLLENLDNGLLEPAIARAYNVLDRADMLPVPPPELQGRNIKIKFISIMHQMQQATGLAAVRTLVEEIKRIAEVNENVIDKLNADVLVDEMARITGVRPDAIKSEDDVAPIRKKRAAERAAQKQGDAMLAATQGAKNMSGVETQKLSQLAQALPPAAAAQGGANAPIETGS